MELVIGTMPHPVAARGIEIVERKGRGHPDTICDALAEELSGALCREYLSRVGVILHHNVDKALLVGGASRPAFGGGEVVEPMEITLAGRAAREAAGPIAVEELAWTTAERWLAREIHALDPVRHVRIHSRIREGSADLTELYMRQRQSGVWLANDTSCGVGHAPDSPLERMVRLVERRISSAAAREGRPEIGEDVKVMGVRHGARVRLTVACALVGRYLRDMAAYLEARTRVAEMARETASDVGGHDVAVDVNAADEPRSGAIYLTVTGTSAEAGDDGQVGRGNRVGGLITPFAPMTMEAAAGKNPVTHVGKLYNIAAARLAASLVAEGPSVEAAQCYLVSQIGRPITDPQAVEVRLAMAPGTRLASVKPILEAIVRRHVLAVDTLWQDVLAGDVPVY